MSYPTPSVIYQNDRLAIVTQEIQKIQTNTQIVFVKSTNTPKYTQIPTNTHDREEIDPSVIYQNVRIATATQEIQKTPQKIHKSFVKSTNTPKYTQIPTNTHDREEIGPSVIYQNDHPATTT